MNILLRRFAKVDHGTTSEKRVGKDLGARLTPASGAMSGAKGDMVLPTLLVEAKATIKSSISIQYSWLVKIMTEALNTNRQPAVTISFVDPQGKPLHVGDWVMIPKTLFRELTDDQAV